MERVAVLARLLAGGCICSIHAFAIGSISDSWRSEGIGAAITRGTGTSSTTRRTRVLNARRHQSGHHAG